ncbi:MAG: hypothetical protein CMK72_04230 [Pseudomonadaceae bacterium]|nr:hypothetical protein [Pseudomonadaceae bacterium]HCP53589.1 hypothetical protein [Pseudomonas sp.]|tara:strand:+ start:1703 stop:2170 length:468 start_codon:yes stop_codon:yes gene_type:complete
MVMKYNTIPAPQFDQKELDSQIVRKQQMHNKYTFIEAASFNEALQVLEQYKSEKYTLDKDFLPVALPMGNGTVVFQFRMVKPPKLIEKELAYIASEVAEQYKITLKAEQAEAVERMVNRLIGEAKEKELKESIAKQDAQLNEARKQAQEILGVTL